MPAARPVTLPENLAELLEQLGGVSPHRVRLRPPPGQATEKDLLRLLDGSGRVCELIDGTLVEKVKGYAESAIACILIKLLGNFLDEHDLGNLAGSDGTMRLMPRLVRVPDVSFVRWEKLPDRRLPAEPIPDLVPDLAVEVLSEGNTPAEMLRKLKDYFLAGVQIVWLVDPRRRTVEVCTAPDRKTSFGEGDTLDGGGVLPGLRLPVNQLFGRLPGRTKTAKPRRKRNEDR
jgi:Uma2 family endonuclease